MYRYVQINIINWIVMTDLFYEMQFWDVFLFSLYSLFVKLNAWFGYMYTNYTLVVFPFLLIINSLVQNRFAFIYCFSILLYRVQRIDVKVWPLGFCNIIWFHIKLIVSTLFEVFTTFPFPSKVSCRNPSTVTTRRV